MKSDQDIIADYLRDELPAHLRAALARGPTRAELADILTHIALVAAPLPADEHARSLEHRTRDNYAKTNPG